MKPRIDIKHDYDEKDGFHEMWADLSNATFGSFLWVCCRNKTDSGLKLSDKLRVLGMEMMDEANRLEAITRKEISI